MIKLEDVHKKLGGRRILKGVELDIPQGSTFVIIGKSGTGKSVTIKHMVGTMRADRGRVIVDGKDMGRLSRRELSEARRKIGLVFQHGALLNSMTVGENVALPLVENERPPPHEVEERVRKALGRVGMERDMHKLPSEVSGGMRKRAGLARAIVRNPEIVLYDEPTSGLDPVMSTAINILIRRMQSDLGATSVVVTHDMESAYFIADQIGMLYEGEIIEVGTPDEIKNSSNAIVKQFIHGLVEGPIPTTE